MENLSSLLLLSVVPTSIREMFFLFGKGFDVAIAFVYCVIFALSVTEGKSIDRRVDGCSGVWKRMKRRKVHVNHIPS